MSYYDEIIKRYTPIDEDEDEMWSRFERQAGCYSYDEDDDQYDGVSDGRLFEKM